MNTFTETRTVTFVVLTCYLCGGEFGLTQRMYQARREDQNDFWCPAGHRQAFTSSESDRLRKQLEAEQRRVIQERAAREHAERERAAAERSASAYKGQATRLRRRIGNGVCPCCNRYFANVDQHMSDIHPGFADAEVTSDV